MDRGLTRALVFGRFQPFHKGHLSLIKWAFDNLGIDEIVVLVGMAS
ncbi:MAG: adenylyltransferase/cytidyltransferase family protein, partial [Desulfurococcales archaeon]|nr:adenylyltransferase/cytidyltransferase family protein [Desulfurococcales archaeon]